MRRLALWALLDRWVERLVLSRGRRDPRSRLIIHSGLAAGWALGLWLSWEFPGAAGVLLLIPLMVTCFFKGLPGLVTLAPATAWHHLVGHAWPDDLLFLCAAAVGVVFSVVTVEKFRQARSREIALEDGLLTARRLQRALEPPRKAEFPFTTVVTWQTVSQELGGDFLCMRAIDSGRTCCLIGDVMGKGVPAALVAAFTVGTFHQVASQAAYPGPRAILDSLNQRLVETFSEQVLFVSMACVELDGARRRWRCCCAGHPPPLLLRRDGSHRVLSGAGILAGLVCSPCLQEVEEDSRPGDRVLLVTDGLVDEEVDDQTVLDVMARWGSQGPESALAGMVEELRRLGPVRTNPDDATAALLCVSDTDAPLRENRSGQARVPRDVNGM
ncbi:MAG: PP2C family protein-serine/threonine phosphatase [Candidatus Eremiobacterota bacterium]